MAGNDPKQSHDGRHPNEQSSVMDTAILDELQIRESRPDDSAAIESLYLRAFPDENLLPLVRDLLSDSVVAISLVAAIDTRIVGHVIFTTCGVVGNSVNASLLGPLAVAPAW